MHHFTVGAAALSSGDQAAEGRQAWLRGGVVEDNEGLQKKTFEKYYILTRIASHFISSLRSAISDCKKGSFWGVLFAINKILPKIP